jgi:hypothetical protein
MVIAIAIALLAARAKPGSTSESRRSSARRSGCQRADARRAVWDQSKATREKEIIPAIYKGDAEDAKKITNGIQSERLSKMWGIMPCKVR